MTVKLKLSLGGSTPIIADTGIDRGGWRLMTDWGREHVKGVILSRYIQIDELGPEYDENRPQKAAEPAMAPPPAPAAAEPSEGAQKSSDDGNQA